MSGISNNPGGFEIGLPEFMQADSIPESLAVEAGNVIEALRESPPKLLVEESHGSDLQVADAPQVNRRYWTTVPSWLISTVAHVALILIMAAWNIEAIQSELGTMMVAYESTQNSADSEDIEQLSMDEMSAQLVSSESEYTPSESPLAVPSNDEAIVGASYTDVIAADMPAIAMPSMTQNLIPINGIASQTSVAMGAALNSRSKETKRDLLNRFGGSNNSEKAVALALKWLALHQDPQTGAWTLAHSLVCKGQCDHPGERRGCFNAATGLALMCFLGAGQTHREGEYKETVFKGLSFLINNMKFQKGQGTWYVGGAGKDDMYAHGIASIVMCEAYGMTKDPALRDAAQAGINFLAYSQNPSTGGWHYAPQGLGDTSIVGWQMMALKSASMSGFAVDSGVVRRANFFLDQMSFDDGASYHYSFDSKTKNAKYKPSTTACAVLCRMYSGMPKDHPSIQAAVAKFSKQGPSKTGTYYNYYATQVMKQVGGKEWENWNSRMRDQLLTTQTTTGHAAGSWFWEDGHSTSSAGRLYTTCMATMILEVYYRYMPIYGEQSQEDTFKL